jgi:histidinol-phosphatase (PHP family)
MYLVDYHTHPYSHGEIEFNREVVREFIIKAEDMGIQELGFSDHDWFIEELDREIYQEAKLKSKIPVLLGMEFDYYPGREEFINQIIQKLQLDYSIGSVHAIGKWIIDHPDYAEEYKHRDISEVYREYFQLVEQAALTGLFNIIGHIDLIKIFNYRPVDKDILSYAEPALRAIKKKELIIEVNTNGFNMPVHEQYPEISILKRAFELGIPITFSSDAHRPERVGERIREVASMVKQIGYKSIATFKERKVKFVNL